MFTFPIFHFSLPSASSLFYFLFIIADFSFITFIIVLYIVSYVGMNFLTSPLVFVSIIFTLFLRVKVHIKVLFYFLLSSISFHKEFLFSWRFKFVSSSIALFLFDFLFCFLRLHNTLLAHHLFSHHLFSHDVTFIFPCFIFIYFYFFILHF